MCGPEGWLQSATLAALEELERIQVSWNGYIEKLQVVIPRLLIFNRPS